MKHGRDFHEPADCVADRLRRIESLSTILLEAARADAGYGSWPVAGSLSHVAERLAELADLLLDAEGRHGELATEELEVLAGIGEWPAGATVAGVYYHATGKRGTRVEDGRPVAEYATEDDARVWLDLAGTVYPD